MRLEIVNTLRAAIDRALQKPGGGMVQLDMADAAVAVQAIEMLQADAAASNATLFKRQDQLCEMQADRDRLHAAIKSAVDSMEAEGLWGACLDNLKDAIEPRPSN